MRSKWKCVNKIMLAGLLILCMVLHIPYTGVNAQTQESDTNAYDIITLSDMFDKNTENRYEAGILQGVGDVGTEILYSTESEYSLQSTAVEGYFVFSESGNNMCIGGYWQGVMFEPHSTDFYLYYVGTDGVPTPMGEIMATEVGVESLTGIEVKLRVTFLFENVVGSLADVRVGVQVNDGYKEYFELASIELTTMAREILLYSDNEDMPLAHRPINKATLSFTDFGFEKETKVEGSENHGIADAETYDRTEVVGYYYFEQDSQCDAHSYVIFGGIWEGIHIYPNRLGDLEIVHVDLHNGQQDATVTSVGIISEDDVGNPLTGKTVKIKITFAFENITEEGVADVNIAFVINDEFRIAYTLKSINTYTLKRELYIWSQDTEHPLIIYAEEETSESLLEVYNLANDPFGYLISGKGDITVNNASYSNGDRLIIPGDYTIRCFGEGAYVKYVSLYTSGDAHPDGSIDIRDLVAVKKATVGIELATKSGSKGADVNSDGAIDVVDVMEVHAHILDTKEIIPKKNNYLSYTEGVMPIGGYFGPYRTQEEHDAYSERIFDYLTEDIYQKIKELGVNLITYTENDYLSQPQDIIDGLSLAEKYGINVYIHDARLRADSGDVSLTDAELAHLLSDYIKYSSFKGITVIDEPFTDYYAPKNNGDNALLSAYAPFAQKINGYSNLTGYINLNPKSHWLSQKDGLDTDYDNYVEEYVTSCNPKYLSFDYYVFDQYTSGDTTTAGYFDNLSVMREKSKKYDIPFYSFIQAGSNWADASGVMSSTKNAVPTKGQMLWNVNTSLAYGAKGIQYFPLIQPHYFAYENNNGNYNYDFGRNGLIGANGTPTQWYYYAQEANRQIASVDEVLMSATSEKILAVGERVQKDTGIYETSYGVLKSVHASDALIGVFSYQNKIAFYIVNYDYENAQTITLNFEGEQEYSMISAMQHVTGKNEDTCVIDMEAGGATLIIVSK